MFWQILWPLVLGFLLSAIVQALVSQKSLGKFLGCDKIKCYTFASIFGAASSSCSYASVALARSIFRKGATFTSAMIFEIASTNLVIEMGVILLIFLGWQFMLAEYIGGIIMIILLAVVFRLTLTPKLISMAKKQAEKGLQGKMEGHAAMDMSISGKKTFWQKLFSRKGITSVSHYFIMDWTSVWFDILLGLLIAGALAAFVPQSFWQAFFLTNNQTLAVIEGPLIGPLVAVSSFVCSVGNIPLAAVLWQGGISFGGVVSFIFADLIVLPILSIYRKYYGWKVMAYIFVVFYLIMAVTGYIIEFLFAALNLIPTERNIIVWASGVQWNYTSWLNIIFLIITGFLIYRFLKTGGIQMLKMMEKTQDEKHECCS